MLEQMAVLIQTSGTEYSMLKTPYSNILSVLYSMTLLQ